MGYTNGLDKEAFLQYMFDEFPSVFSNSFSREMLENIVNYGTADNFTHTKNDLYYFLRDMIPQVEPKDLIPFMDKNALTNEVLGILENKYYYGGNFGVQEDGHDLENPKVIRTLDELENYLEDNGWHVGWSSEIWLIRKVSPAGEDFCFTLSHHGDIDEAIQGIKKFAAEFDVEKHATQWNVARSNGAYHSTRIGGLPNEKALAEDAAAIQKMLCDLADGVVLGYKSVDEKLSEATSKCEVLNNDVLDKSDVDFERE